MKTIILISNYTGEILKDVIKLLPAPPSVLKMGYIKTAKNIYGRPESYVPGSLRALQSADFQAEVYDLAGKTEDQVREDLSKFDVIYIAGGNTFCLLQEMQKCNFTSVVRELLEKGIILIGESAGASVMGPDIRPAEWLTEDNTMGLQDLTGLYLVPFAVIPHFTGSLPESVGREVMKAPYDVRYLRDDQGILVKDGKVTLFGEK